jgi:hypothetical protein
MKAKYRSFVGYLKKVWSRKPVWDDTTRFTITVEMRSRWIPHFMSMLKYMEHLGNIGSSRGVSLYADGDGDFRPKFHTNIKWEKKEPVKTTDGDYMFDAG